MLSLSTVMVVTAGIVWLGLLFAVALAGERSPERWRRIWPVVYSLSLAVYCTAWTFYGTTTQAVAHGWPIPPTFVGTIILFVFCFPFLRRLVRLSKAANATSIADFIASRFGKSSALAAVVTGVALLGLVPYISLQLKAVAMSFGALTLGRTEVAEPAAWQDLAFYVALFMAIFAVLFGTRRASATEHNRGLVLAMGFESLLKLSAMLALGVFVLFWLYPGPGDMFEQTVTPAFSGTDSFLTLMLLGALAMFTLPHQFHIGVVECRSDSHLKVARWLFPLFLVLIALPIVPLARAGMAHFGEAGIAPDLYVLMLPLTSQADGLALFAFLGGLSAATGMVILASLTLSIMIGNHWLTPALLNRRWGAVGDLRVPVRLQRRVGIAVVLLMAYAYSRAVGMAEALADIGALSFSGLAQLGPAVVLAVYRPGLPARAIIAGIAGGVATWAYVLFLPLGLAVLGLRPDWMGAGPLGLTWLAPENLFGMTAVEPLARAVVASLLVNCMVILLMVRFSPSGGGEGAAAEPLDTKVFWTLADRFLPPQRVQMLSRGQSDARELARRLEHELTAVVGSASARLLMDAARRRTPAPLDTVADLVGQAAEQARFSQEVLSGALENMSQGVCVVDRDMRLVAWNSSYLALFDYPDELIRVGRPVADLLRHNACQGLMEGGDVDAMIERRLAHKRAGTRHRVERPWPDGRIIEIRGHPMPGGGFVATFTDVTAFRHAEQELKRINETLEQRVAERTGELEQAKLSAEHANAAKTRFLAAVSHDLVQPLNAAQLLTHSLGTQVDSPRAKQSLSQISGALGATEDLLEGLLDISRLDAGGLEPRISRFALSEMFDQLHGEFSVLASEAGLRLDCMPTRAWVKTDAQLLRRILQNFLSNAVRYTESGRVLIGCRRRGNDIMIGVWDTGPGIPGEYRRVIFEEFRRLDDEQHAPGLGLGLAIAERMTRLLGHELVLDSRPGRGTLFGVVVPRVAPERPAAAGPDLAGEPDSARVLVVDNDPDMLGSLNTLLGDWGFEVATAARLEQARELAQSHPPSLLLLDYHLDGGRTGLEVLEALRTDGCTAPAILISADHGADLKQAARQSGCELLHKPIRPLALRSLMSRLLRPLSGSRAIG
ncbi:PAS domain-containing hybrid sensor histidine kinase/response regulator [Wenzhouxiangella sp. AB-CW3]|uniref:PAS domain-containing hybrid sensor histidine kinase/response regulator n=1 Tax=Wenzhouxiangella sp. AB-CW3 TaxID=2771012 RepID=UPI001CC2E6C8|nr:PAS domain-containing hybrid sensor histidine kinase/response regulator [Wenzhouxiangella sp. AB-CW3]